MTILASFEAFEGRIKSLDGFVSGGGSDFNSACTDSFSCAAFALGFVALVLAIFLFKLSKIPRYQVGCSSEKDQLSSTRIGRVAARDWDPCGLGINFRTDLAGLDHRHSRRLLLLGYNSRLAYGADEYLDEKSLELESGILPWYCK